MKLDYGAQCAAPVRSSPAHTGAVSLDPVQQGRGKKREVVPAPLFFLSLYRQRAKDGLFLGRTSASEGGC